MHSSGPAESFCSDIRLKNSKSNLAKLRQVHFVKRGRKVSELVSWFHAKFCLVTIFEVVKLCSLLSNVDVSYLFSEYKYIHTYILHSTYFFLWNIHCCVATDRLQGVLTLCEFHYCEFHYCGFSKLLLKWWSIFDSSPLIQNSKFNNFLWVRLFLCKNLSNFVPPTWKLHNPYYHSTLQKLWHKTQIKTKTLKNRKKGNGNICRLCHNF